LGSESLLLVQVSSLALEWDCAENHAGHPADPVTVAECRECPSVTWSWLTHLPFTLVLYYTLPVMLLSLIYATSSELGWVNVHKSHPGVSQNAS
jgi:hypothetical protein